MFTGLVEGMGQVERLEPEGDGRRLWLTAPFGADPVHVGESIAVNGVCLTVIAQTSSALGFQLAPETLRRSNLGLVEPRQFVNLERALKLGDRLGGHWVQGHVDGMGRFVEQRPDGDWWMYFFEAPGELTRYMIPKGSIAIDGVSLTLVDVGPTLFSVALIPHTLSVTTLGRLQPGQAVNLEVDLLAKYVEKLLGNPTSARPAS